MDTVYLLKSKNPSGMLQDMTNRATKCFDEVVDVNTLDELPDLRNKKIIFSVQLSNSGYCFEIDSVVDTLWERGKKSLEGSSAIVLINNDNDLFTKTYAQNLILHANMLGCNFIGRPFVEAVGNLSNMLVAQKTIPKDLIEVCLTLCEDISTRLRNYEKKCTSNPVITVLHSSNFETSNTLILWEMVKKHLKNIDINVLHIENGTVKDCIGCPYKMCKHYGEKELCFYGGIMVEEVYPAILESDAIIWICPNYNDNLSANISAVINRLTALFRKTKFYNKSIFSIIVSGNSGSDAIAKQLISALNINKTFRLPPYFSLTATANDYSAILRVDNIEEQAKEFADNIMKELHDTL